MAGVPSSTCFIPWLTAAWLVILPKAYYALRWELEAREVSKGHCAFLGKALHLGPIQVSIHMSAPERAAWGCDMHATEFLLMYSGHISFHTRAGHG